MSRYRYVTDEIRRIGAKRLLEVGTWRGDRAIEMIKAATETPGLVIYHGFDFFEGMSPHKSNREFNVKAAFSKDYVEKRLVGWAEGQDVSFHLHLGDTRKTLPPFATDNDQFFDFAWIDGGHSETTIRSDWAACCELVRPGGVILLDDYYSGRALRNGFGCNFLVEEMRNSALSPIVLPKTGPVEGGGGVQVVKVVL